VASVETWGVVCVWCGVCGVWGGRARNAMPRNATRRGSGHEHEHEHEYLIKSRLLPPLRLLLPPLLLPPLLLPPLLAAAAVPALVPQLLRAYCTPRHLPEAASGRR